MVDWWWLRQVSWPKSVLPPSAVDTFPDRQCSGCETSGSCPPAKSLLACTSADLQPQRYLTGENMLGSLVLGQCPFDPIACGHEHLGHTYIVRIQTSKTRKTRYRMPQIRDRFPKTCPKSETDVSQIRDRIKWMIGDFRGRRSTTINLRCSRSVRARHFDWRGTPSSSSIPFASLIGPPFPFQ